MVAIGVGSESENAGNVLVLKSIPASLMLGLRIVAYGEGDAALDLAISPGDNPTVLLAQQSNKVQFSPLREGDVLGIASLRLSLGLAIDNPGMYWLSAAIGGGPTMELPLFITQRSDWSSRF